MEERKKLLINRKGKSTNQELQKNDLYYQMLINDVQAIQI